MFKRILISTLIILGYTPAAEADAVTETLAQEHGMSEGAAREEVRAVFSAISSVLEDRRPVVIRNFGRFEVVDRKVKRPKKDDSGDESAQSRPAVVFVPSPALLRTLSEDSAEELED